MEQEESEDKSIVSVERKLLKATSDDSIFGKSPAKIKFRRESAYIVEHFRQLLHENRSNTFTKIPSDEGHRWFQFSCSNTFYRSRLPKKLQKISRILVDVFLLHYSRLLSRIFQTFPDTNAKLGERNSRLKFHSEIHFVENQFLLKNDNLFYLWTVNVSKDAWICCSLLVND